MTPTKPPETISILWCSKCGRDDRFAPFTGKSHFNFRERCSNDNLYQVTYVFSVASPKVET